MRSSSGELPAMHSTQPDDSRRSRRCSGTHWPTRPPTPAARARSTLAQSRQLTRLVVHEYHAMRPVTDPEEEDDEVDWCDVLSGPGSMQEWGPQLYRLAPWLKELRLHVAAPAQQHLEFYNHFWGERALCVPAQDQRALLHASAHPPAGSRLHSSLWDTAGFRLHSSLWGMLLPWALRRRHGGATSGHGPRQ